MRCQWVTSKKYWQGDRTVSRCTDDAEIEVTDNTFMLNGQYCKTHFGESKKLERYLKETLHREG